MASSFDPNLKKYMYGITLKTVIPGQDPINLENYIRDMTVYCFYDQHVFPVFQLEFFLDRDSFKTVQAAANDIKFLLNVDKYPVAMDSTDADWKLAENFLTNEVLIPYNIPRTPLPVNVAETDDERNVEIKDKGQTDTNNAPVFRMVVECFMEKHVNLNKGTISAILSGSTPGDAILYLMNRAKAKNFLMNQPDNTNPYDQIVLPGMNFTKTVQWMQEVYGVYKTGMRLFCDLKWNYVLNRDQKFDDPVAPATAPDSYSSAYIELVELRQQSGDVYGCYYDKDNSRVYMKMTDRSSFVTEDSAIREIFGEYIKIQSRTKDNRAIQRTMSYMFAIENNVDGDVQNADEAKENMVWNHYSNAWAETEYRSTMARNHATVNIPWQDFDVEMITPYRSYHIVYSNKEYADIYNGDYQLRQSVFKFSKGKQQTFFRVFGGCVFSKLNSQYFT